MRELWKGNETKRLVEPMCGSLAISLGLSPRRALLNDYNRHLINFYRQVKSGLELDIQMENESELYYESRDRFNQLMRDGLWDSVEAAQLFYYLNRTCYNGLCRFNRSGEFNVPFGRYTTINYAKDFLEYRVVLHNWDFTVGDFSDIRIEEDDFVYVDPPYDVEFTNYSGIGFNWESQVRLAEWASDLKVPVVVSNQATERVKELYESLGFTIHTAMAPRAISRTGDRTRAEEVIAFRNFSPEQTGIVGFGMGKF